MMYKWKPDMWLRLEYFILQPVFKKRIIMNLKKKIYIVLMIVFAIGFFVCMGLFIHNKIVEKKAEEKYEELLDMQLEQSIEESELSVQEEIEEEDILTTLGIEIPEKTLDFEKLQEENEHIYAWIYIPGTKVDYPILQHPTEESYYLDRNLDGSRGYPGCIYTDYLNEKDFSDNNTVIYGHNMKDGTMFGELHKFEDKAFFEENKYAYIYTPEKIYVYEIFAAYEFSDLHLLYGYDMDNPEIFEIYLDSVFNTRGMNAHIRSTSTVTKEDKIITLSTCIGNKPKNRYLIQGVLLNKE